MIFELCSFLVTTEREDSVSKIHIPNEARKSRVIFFELFFRVKKKPSYDVIFRKFCLKYDVIINFVTRVFLLPLFFQVVFRILGFLTLCFNFAASKNKGSK